MTLPRPLLLAVLGLALVLTALLALGRLPLPAGGGPDEGAPAPPAAARRAPAPAAAATAPPGLPAPVARALRDRLVVVLALSQRGAADDAATDAAVSALAADPPAGTAVFRDDVERLGLYRSVLRDLGVSQVPAVVVIGPDRRARLQEGYVDAASLRQRVLDARP